MCAFGAKFAHQRWRFFSFLPEGECVQKEELALLWFRIEDDGLEVQLSIDISD
jgi:hypothetical protein